MRVVAPHGVERNSEAGFTLVEMLVGLSLLALMSVLLFGGFRFGLRAWESGDDQIAAIGEIERTQNLLRTLLSEAQLPVIAVNDGDIRQMASFVGEDERLWFVAPLPAHRGVGGLYEFELTKVRNGAEDALSLAWRSYRVDRPLGDDRDFDDESILLRSTEGLRLAFFGQSSDQRDPAWLDSWDGSRGLPLLVRLTIEDVGDGRRDWPELVVALKLR
jgi:general secretion pathway protein J